MLKARVFVDLDPAVFPDDSPEVLTGCFDPNRIFEMWNHYRTFGGKNRFCIPVFPPGGSLAIPARSPLASTPQGHRCHWVIKDSIAMAINVLGAKKIRSSVHYPCLAARIAQLFDVDVLEWHVAAGDSLSDLYPECDIISLVHIDWHGHTRPNDTVMNTYRFDPLAFGDWRQSNAYHLYVELIKG